MSSPAALQRVKITSLEQGHQLVAAIQERRLTLLREMSTKDLPIGRHQEMQDERYEYFKAKKHIQAQMGKLVTAARKSDQSLSEVA